VANVIQIDKKLKHTKEKKAEIIKKRKILAVQKVFQCMQCVFKCEKCGTQIQPEEQRQQRPIGAHRTPYRFCESCAEEYSDYIERLRGRGDSENYWHNEIWVELWRKWIDYQGVINSYLKSKEFRQLLEELKDTGPNK